MHTDFFLLLFASLHIKSPEIFSSAEYWQRWLIRHILFSPRNFTESYWFCQCTYHYYYKSQNELSYKTNLQ